MKTIQWILFDGMAAGAGTAMMMYAFTTYSPIAMLAGIVGLINTPVSIILGTWRDESVDNKEVR